VSHIPSTHHISETLQREITRNHDELPTVRFPRCHSGFLAVVDARNLLRGRTRTYNQLNNGLAIAGRLPGKRSSSVFLGHAWAMDGDDGTARDCRLSGDVAWSRFAVL